MGSKIDRTGEVNINSQGLEMKIIKYRNANDIDVFFIKSGYISEHKQYGKFKTGTIKDINYIGNRTHEGKLGDINFNNFGTKMTIIKYRGSKDIDVMFENGYVAKQVTYDSFKRGNLKNPYEKRVYNHGYIGKGKYSELTHKKFYRTWMHMLERCYSQKYNKNRESYNNVILCEDWHNFQTFAKWCDYNYYEIPGKVMCLDKDILIKGNRIYKPDACCFVSNDINSMFTRGRKTDNACIGVHYSKNEKLVNRFIATVNTLENKTVHLGTYKTELEAFEAYKIAKEKIIKQLANKYKEYIPTKIYDAIYNYRIEITDKEINYG